MANRRIGGWPLVFAAIMPVQALIHSFYVIGVFRIYIAKDFQRMILTMEKVTPPLLNNQQSLRSSLALLFL
jgi:hypothetical protein